ncbi:uncharacterized protein Dmoj_GI10252 [Drosophila mojavensis]|uniref:Uncharacterized protein n=1 Tax=Drosophila mojavensis TaxID=7230 RepID=B4KDD2_DROMO|nr:uncharacterized protein Dmoj_GI10252 [Drosophila mojavensis]
MLPGKPLQIKGQPELRQHHHHHHHHHHQQQQHDISGTINKSGKVYSGLGQKLSSYKRVQTPGLPNSSRSRRQDAKERQEERTFVMSARISVAILWLIVARLEGNTAAGNSGERVHIRLHMPEVVRQHTHFHKVYKHFPLPVVPPQQLMPVAAPPMGKPHVSLLGYTTTASGSGGMASSVKQLMATADTPMAMSMATLKPKYGPALFDNYNQQQGAELKATLPSTTPATVKLGSTAQQQRLQQQMEMEAEPETETELEPELENNELLNGNLMAALQREYLAKFAGRQQKRKKVNHLSKPQNRPRQKPQQLLSNSGEQFDDYQDEMDTRYAEPDEPNEQYLDAAKSWAELGENEDDSAAAFSGQHNALSSVPSVDDFLNEVGGKSYAPYYGSMYNQYGSTAYTDSRYNEYGNTDSMYNDYDNIDPTGGSVWQATPAAAYNSYPRPTKATPIRPRPRQRARPSAPATSSTRPGQNGGKMRYVKLTTRKKRKNRIRAKRYRI